MATIVKDPPAPQRAESAAKERRDHPRVRCGGNVELRRVPPAPAESICGRIENLSIGGCYLETERLLEIGEQLVMEIRLNGLDLRMIASVRSAKSDPRCWAGLEFVGISAEGLKKLQALIEVIAREQSLLPESPLENH